MGLESVIKCNLWSRDLVMKRNIKHPLNTEYSLHVSGAVFDPIQREKSANIWNRSFWFWFCVMRSSTLTTNLVWWDRRDVSNYKNTQLRTVYVLKNRYPLSRWFASLKWKSECQLETTIIVNKLFADVREPFWQL